MDTPQTAQLVAFDVDGTLIESPDQRVVWQLLNDRFGDGAPDLEGRYQAYMAGEITYARWVDLDVGGWQAAGATRAAMEAVIRDGLAPVPGARGAIAELCARGYPLAVISGTLDLTLELLLPDARFDEVFTNRIWFHPDGRIAGWQATPYDMEGKAEALRRIAERRGISLDQTVYVGDNINDISVMKIAGLAVAFNPKAPEVEGAADVVVRGDLRGLLEIIS